VAQKGRPADLLVSSGGAGSVEGQAGVEKSTDCYHFAYMMKEMMREEEKEQAEGLIFIYLTIPVTQAYNQSVIGPLCDPALLSTRLFLPHRGLVPAATMVVILA
jgi:hypothetical protein